MRKFNTKFSCSVINSILLSHLSNMNLKSTMISPKIFAGQREAHVYKQNNPETEAT